MVAFTNEARGIDIEIEGTSAQPEPVMATSLSIDRLQTKSSRIQDKRWIVAGFGKRSVSAAKSLERMVDYAGMIPTDTKANGAETRRLLEELEANDFHDVTGKKLARTVVVLFDPTREHLASAERFAGLVRAVNLGDTPLLGVMPYPLSIGQPEIGLRDNLLEKTMFGRLLIIPQNDVPTTDSRRPAPIARTIRTLIEASDNGHLPVSDPPEKFSLFAAAHSQHGIRDIHRVIRLAIAASTNPWIPPFSFDFARVIISSVGRPPPEFEIQDDVNKCSPAEASKSLSIKTDWVQRRFLMGGSVPTTAAILFEGPETRRPEHTALFEAAQTILRCAGIEIRDSETQDDFSFRIVANGGEMIEVIVFDEYLPDMQVPRSPYVRLVSTSKIRAEILRNPVTREEFPLLLDDLYFLGEANSLAWAAEFLAQISVEKQFWSTRLQPLVTGAVESELQQRRSGFKLLRQIEEKAVKPSISIADVAIDKADRLPARKIKIFGRMNIAVRSDVDGDSEVFEDTLRASFVAQIGTDGCKIIDGSLY